MDEFAYYNSRQEQKTEFIFNNAQQVYVPDQNSGSYPSGQVVFDLASLSNKYSIPKSGFSLIFMSGNYLSCW